MLNITKINESQFNIIAPKGIRFISEWIDYNFSELPEKCIIDKTIPGCGYTQWCITNNCNVILASPRKMLLENKKEQHEDDVFLVINSLDKDPDIDRKILSNETKATNYSSTITNIILDEDKTKEVESGTYEQIYNQYLEYSSKRGLKPHKILVTYDSYYIVKKILKYLGIFDTFYTVIDEFQAILSDSRFKSSTEVEFMSVLRDVNKVHFISATPVLDQYIQMLDDFKILPFFKINWKQEDPSRIMRPKLEPLVMRSIAEAIGPIIESYKSKKFEKIYYNGKEISSDEAVFYLNSVNHIISIIKKFDLKPNEVNILCSKTPNNEKRIKSKLGKGWSIGKVPLRNQKPKMFTFCTRTVYLGADFYSTCARTFIFGDSNSDCLSIDISMDLPQILGRQRLPENPWKNSATFYYRSTCDWRKMKKEDFDVLIQRKIDQTNKMMKAYQNNLSDPDPGVVDTLVNGYRRLAITNVYKYDYLAVNTKFNSPVPEFNQYVYVSDLMTFFIQQIDFADRFSVFNELNETFDSIGADILRDIVMEYEKLKNNISARLKFICNLNEDIRNQFLGQLTNDDYAKSYYLQLGVARCRALNYRIDRIKKELGIVKFDPDILDNEIYKSFKIGDKLKKSSIKEILNNIYSAIGYKATPKASDLGNWFELETTSIRDGLKNSAGFKIVKKR